MLRGLLQDMLGPHCMWPWNYVQSPGRTELGVLIYLRYKQEHDNLTNAAVALTLLILAIWSYLKFFFLPIFLTLPRFCDNPQVTHLHSPAVSTFPLLKIPKPNVQSVLHSKYPRLLFSHGRRGAKNSFLLDDETLWKVRGEINLAQEVKWKDPIIELHWSPIRKLCWCWDCSIHPKWEKSQPEESWQCAGSEILMLSPLSPSLTNLGIVSCWCARKMSSNQPAGVFVLSPVSEKRQTINTVKSPIYEWVPRARS